MRHNEKQPFGKKTQLKVYRGKKIRKRIKQIHFNFMVLFFNPVPLAAQFKNYSLERINTLHLYVSATKFYCMKCKESVLSVCI